FALIIEHRLTSFPLNLLRALFERDNISIKFSSPIENNNSISSSDIPSPDKTLFSNKLEIIMIY
ncbi:MAG: hypothetical protein ACPL6D_13535, partial [Thermodesulfobacteriota bacterium]